MISFFSLELFPRPKLKVTASQPTEGNSVNLSCETQLPLERSDSLLHFVFFRDKEVILSNWSRSPEFQITSIWREDSGWYWCGAETVTHSVCKRSHPLHIQVQSECGRARRAGGLGHPPWLLLQAHSPACRSGPPGSGGCGHPDIIARLRLRREVLSLKKHRTSFPPLFL